MGVVYLAHDAKLDRPVAIKSLPAEVMSNPLVRSRFHREVRVLASLNHPSTATIHEELEEGEGADAEHDVRDVTFEKVSILGSKLTEGSRRVHIGKHTENVRFRAEAQ
jgi:serine/threonine protein kinase